MSAYLILARDPREDAPRIWGELGTLEATSQEQAVRKAAEKHADYSVFLAIPTRSWKPLKVERVQTVQTRISDAPAGAQEAATT